MKNKDGGEGEGAINFPPLKRGGGGLIREGGLNRGFTVLSSVNVKNRDLSLSVSRRSINCLGK